MIGQGNPEEVIQTTMRAWLYLLSLPAHTVLFFRLINTLHFSLLPIFVGVLFWKPKGPGVVTGTVTQRTGFSAYCLGLTSVSGQAPKPCFKLLWAKATWDQLKPRAQQVGEGERVNPFLPWHLLGSLQQDWLFKCPSALNWPFPRIGQPGESFQMWLSMVSKPQEAIYLFY